MEHHLAEMQISGKTPGSVRLPAWGIIIVLTIIGAIGFVYLPLFALFAVAGAFALGLWLLVGKSPRGNASSLLNSVDDGIFVNSRIGSHPWIRRIVPIYLLLFWFVMVLPMLNVAPREVGERAAAAAASGSIQNQIMVGSFGLIGTMLLVTVLPKFSAKYRLAVGFWVLYLLWGYTTLFWTAYTPLSMRSLVAYLLVSFGSLGFGAGFYGAQPDGPRLLLKHIFAAGVISALIVVVPLPLHLGQYNPLDPSQRMTIAGDFTRFVSRPVICSMLILGITTVLGLRRWRWHDALWMLLLIAPIFVLKTRGPVLWAALAFGIVYLVYRTRAHERVFQIGMILVLALGMYVSYSRGVVESFIPFLTRGDLQNTLTLTGRTDLWPILLAEAGEHPWIGVGFAAFWNPTNLFVMEGAVGFPVVSAHNGFLEELLATGMVGLSLFAVFWFYGMLLAMRNARRGDPLGWITLLFMVAYLFLNLTTSLMQSYMEITFIIVFALIGLMASRNAAAGERIPEIPTKTQISTPA